MLAGAGATSWDCTMVLCGMVGGGKVVLARGDGCDTLDVLGFRGFFVVALAGGVGVARGVSCGDRSELMSIVSCSDADHPTCSCAVDEKGGVELWSVRRNAEFLRVLCHAQPLNSR